MSDTPTRPHHDAWVVRALQSGGRAQDQPDWPLPDPELPASPRSRTDRSPDVDLLLRIALDEEDNEAALRWHTQLGRGMWHRDRVSTRVAAAVADTHPRESIAIWRDLAEQAIARTNRSGYEASLTYLRPLRDILRRLGREAEWEAYLGELRNTHARKRTFIPMLDRLSDGPLRLVGD